MFRWKRFFISQLFLSISDKARVRIFCQVDRSSIRTGNDCSERSNEEHFNLKFLLGFFSNCSELFGKLLIFIIIRSKFSIRIEVVQVKLVLRVSLDNVETFFELGVFHRPHKLKHK